MRRTLKKMIALTLCIMMLFSSSISVWADPIRENEAAVQNEQSMDNEQAEQVMQPPQNSLKETDEQTTDAAQEALEMEAGYIFEYPTEAGKDALIQIGDDGTVLTEAVLTIRVDGIESTVSGETIENVAGFHLPPEAELICLDGYSDGQRVHTELQALDAEEGITMEGDINSDTPQSEPDLDIESYIASDLEKESSEISEVMQRTGQTGVSLFSENSDKEKIVVIDPGHSVNSPGTYKTWDGVVYHEEDLTLKIAAYVKEALGNYSDVKVYLTRDEKGDPTIRERVEYASKLNADLLVSIHLNSAGTVNDAPTTANGVEVLVAKIGTYHPENAQKGQNLASAILNELVALGFNNRGFVNRMLEDETYEDGSQADYYGIIRYGQMMNVPSIIVEHGFLNNESDFRKFLSTDAGLQKLGEADARGIVEYLGLEKEPEKDGWHTDSAGGRYYISQGARLTGWQTLEKKVYYFDYQGIAATGTPVIDGKKYWFDGNGVQQTGWLTLVGMDLYFDPSDSGAAATGVRIVEGQLLLFDENGVRCQGTATPVVYGKKYYLLNGVVKTGWMQLGDWKMYFDPSDNGAAVVGSREIDGKSYMFDNNGILMQPEPGMFVRDGKKYYVLEDGSYFSGWMQLTADWRLYFDPSDNCAAATGIHKIENDIYYFDSNGVMQKSVMPVVDGKKYYMDGTGKARKGWMQLTADWRLYFDPSDNCAAATGIHKIGDDVYYFDPNGVMQKSVMPVVDGKKYYIDGTGKARKGWVQLTADWRLYFDPADNCAAATGFRTISEKTYYFDTNGIMQTGGMPIIAGKKYMVNGDGSIYMGWLQLTDTWRLYCDPEDNGAILTGFQKISENTYYFDENGIMAVGFQIVDGKHYCFNDEGIMYAGGTPVINGKKYGFEGDGVQIFGWYNLGGSQMYFNPENNGAAVTGNFALDHIVYIFNEDGVLVDSRVQYVSDRDPVNGKTYTLESAFVADPQIGKDITEDEFFAAVVYAEAGNQGLPGQTGVALTILNRMESSQFPDTLNFVVYAANQFEVARNGSLTKYLEAFRDDDETILRWIEKAETDEAVKAAKQIMKEYKERGTKRIIKDLEMPAGQDDFCYLFFMTPEAFTRLNLDPVGSNSLTYKNTIFFEKWVKQGEEFQAA